MSIKSFIERKRAEARYHRAATAQIKKKQVAAYYKAKEGEDVKYAKYKAAHERQVLEKKLKAPRGNFFSGFQSFATSHGQGKGKPKAVATQDFFAPSAISSPSYFAATKKATAKRKDKRRKATRRKSSRKSAPRYTIIKGRAYPIG